MKVKSSGSGRAPALLLRGAHHELRRRGALLDQIPKGELEDLAVQAADDALAAILAKLDTFRGASRFTTWAYKFVLLEAGVKARRRAWQGREVALEEDSRRRLAGRAPSVQQPVEEAELDQYVDLELAGARADARLPGMRPHFEGCPACREDHESLRELARGGVTPLD